MDYCDRSDQLPDKLATFVNMAGILYIGHHDLVTYDNPRIASYLEETLSSKPNSGLYLELEELPLKSHTSHSFCFINANLSARLIRYNSFLIGLPEAILSKIASGFVGLLGEVQPEYANQIAINILKRLNTSAEQGASPPEILCQLRAAAVRKLIEDKSPDNLRYFLNVFMYVYYGNPLLKVIPRTKELEGTYE